MAGNLGGAVGSVPIGLQPIGIQTDWFINFQVGVDLSTATVDATTPVLHQTHAILGASMATTSAVIGDVSLSQRCELQALGVETGAAADTTTPSVNQGQSLHASELVTASVATTIPLLGYIHNLYGGDLATTNVAYSTPVLSEFQYFGTSSIETSAPEITTPVAGQIHHVTASVPTTGALVIDPSTLAQVSVLAASGLDLAPDGGAPIIGSATLVFVWHLFAPNEIATYSPVISTPSMPSQSHNLSTASINTSTLVFETPTLIEAYALHSDQLQISNAVLGSGYFSQTHNLYAPSIDSRFYYFSGDHSVIGATPMASMIVGGSSGSTVLNVYNPYTAVELNQICNFQVNQSIDTSSVAISTPVLDQTSILTTASITTGAVEIQPTQFTYIAALGGTSFTLFTVSITTPSLLQAHVLSALSNLDPVILQPLPGTFIEIIGQATLRETSKLRASGEVVTSYVSIGATTLGYTAHIAPDSISTTAVQIGATNFDQTCILSPTPIVTGPTSLSDPIAISTHILFGNGISGTAIPVESAVLIQRHGLKADNFGPVSYFWAQSSGAHPMGFAPIAAPAHVAVPKVEISQAVFGERYTTPPNPITTSSADLGAPIIRQTQHLGANTLVAPAVEFSVVVVSEGNQLDAIGVVAAAPVFSTPDVFCNHFIYGVDFATGPPLFGAPKLAFRESYVALSLTTTSVDVGIPGFYSPKLAYAKATWSLTSKTSASVFATATTAATWTPFSTVVEWSKTAEATASWTICANINAEWMIKDQIDG
jgi:hypothetical protein